MLRASFPAAEIDPGQARAVARGFLLALEGVPAFALEEGVKRVLRGQAGIKAGFMPTAPQFRQLVDEVSRPARWHARRLRFLLEAEVEREVSVEERARVAGLLRGLNLSPPDEARGAGAAA